jgi:hypothetical protein
MVYKLALFYYSLDMSKEDLDDVRREIGDMIWELRDKYVLRYGMSILRGIITWFVLGK